VGGGDGGAGDCGREEEGGEGEVEGLVEGVGWGEVGWEGAGRRGGEFGGGEEEEEKGEGERGGDEGACLGVEDVLGEGWEGGACWVSWLLFVVVWWGWVGLVLGMAGDGFSFFACGSIRSCGFVPSRCGLKGISVVVVVVYF